MSETTFMNKISAGVQGVKSDLEAAGLRVSVKDSTYGVQLTAFQGDAQTPYVRVRFHPNLLEMTDGTYTVIFPKAKWSGKTAQLVADHIAHGEQPADLHQSIRRAIDGEC